MKSIVYSVLCLLIVFSLSGCVNNATIKYPYTQEYIVGDKKIIGDVNINKYTEIDKAFAIGANDDGYAVFKDPKKAFDVFLEKYADGINLIKEENNLPLLTQKNYDDYKVYGWQVSTGTQTEQEQAKFVSSFLDIYENSY